jgi:SAM-dependent methyltransferase
MPALERLFFSRVPSGAAVLDLCCGSGHVTKELVARGYQVAGVDVSASLIEHARESLPDVPFFVQDARELTFRDDFDAILSTFDSLNHILSLEDLQCAFAGARRALRAAGVFVFDMNLEEAYSADLHSWAVTVDDTNVTLVRGAYNRELHLGETELIWFEQADAAENVWHQHRSVVKERCYPEQDILAALGEAGFGEVTTTSAVDAGMSAQLGFGRWFFTAR